ncbi:B12-binding domain-containing radical SAM protein [Dorea sp. Marseille-P4042]|uniref:B12-binding domain-containing radical SAM protein n=1 Tax=Dorea sp. Marseille-P4042 TaxID=2080749 RepID=UPI000CFA7A85|nr:B12-binding domain-containing radical SAM protein [Dorea sp. Marseille-P4042]
MKILLVAINAKYIHSNLAVYCLRAYAEKNMPQDVNVQIELAEYTINQNRDEVLKDIYRRQAEMICFSCYIWNLDYVESMIRDVKKVMKDVIIWAGGPEVSYDSRETLGRLPELTGVMKGEGEKTFAKLCKVYGKRSETSELSLEQIDGITFRCPDGTICERPWRVPMDLSEVPFVYHDMKKFENKIIYYETSRGCPFSCSYCLSSIDKRLRFRSLDLVFNELQFFLDHKVPQVKFVDRTFNCKHDHAMAIWEYIQEHDNGITNFHFEVAADLLNDEEIRLIRQMRPGLIQLEIGVQSTNTDTIREIRRTMRLEEVREHVARIKEKGNIHQHLDLIAGLPYEDIKSFRKSFDDVYSMRPDQLQLGFLKVLKGSYMQEMQQEYELRYKDEPPYEVLSTKWLPYSDVIELKGIEEMVEIYYNSGQFTHVVEALVKNYASAYQMYQDLWQYYEEHDYMGIQHRRSARYEIVLDFVKEKYPEQADVMRELLTYDYYLRENAKSRPEFAGEDATDKRFVRAFYEEEEKERKHLPGYEQFDRNQMRKMTHLEYFPHMGKMLLFDYKFRNPLNQEARTCMIKKDSLERRG